MFLFQANSNKVILRERRCFIAADRVARPCAIVPDCSACGKTLSIKRWLKEHKKICHSDKLEQRYWIFTEQKEGRCHSGTSSMKERNLSLYTKAFQGMYFFSFSINTLGLANKHRNPKFDPSCSFYMSVGVYKWESVKTSWG